MNTNRFSKLTKAELYNIYVDYIVSREKGFRCESLVPFTKDFVNEINTSLPVNYYMSMIEKDFLEEVAKRYFA